VNTEESAESLSKERSEIDGHSAGSTGGSTDGLSFLLGSFGAAISFPLVQTLALVVATVVFALRHRMKIILGFLFGIVIVAAVLRPH